LQVSNQLEFKPLQCSECQRPNSPSASLCLWCGILLDSKTGLAYFPTTIVELDYLSGVDRLDTPMPVRLTINAEGVEIKEVLPGSRIFWLAADAILEARVVDKMERIKVEKRVSFLQRLLNESSSLQSQQFTERITHDYILTLRYRLRERVFTAAFHRPDRGGKAMVHNTVKTINALVKWQTLKPQANPPEAPLSFEETSTGY
jgi:hypothetical protein